MGRKHEKLLHKAWKWLEEDLGLIVAGNIDLECDKIILKEDLKFEEGKVKEIEKEKNEIKGNIDLVAFDKKKDKYYGVEVKPSEDIISGNSQIDRQLIKYACAGAGSIDYLYIATDSNEVAQRAKGYYNFTKEHLRELQQPIWNNYVRKTYDFSNIQPFRCGIICLNENPFFHSRADRIRRAKAPKLDFDNESWVKHRIFMHFNKDKQEIEPEAEIPPPTKSGHPRKIDFGILPVGRNSTDIIKNQETLRIIGIEVKNKFDGGVLKQLQDYIKSEALTEVYLAIPNRLAEKALPKLRETDIGLIAVDRNHVKTIKTANRKNILYDAMELSRSGNGVRFKKVKRTITGEEIEPNKAQNICSL